MLGIPSSSCGGANHSPPTQPVENHSKLVSSSAIAPALINQTIDILLKEDSKKSNLHGVYGDLTSMEKCSRCEAKENTDKTDKNKKGKDKKCTPQTMGRQTRRKPDAKPYVGYDRVPQSLRHIATVIFDSVSRLKVESPSVQIASPKRTPRNCRPVEVQATVIGDTLYISSNNYSDRILEGLYSAFKNKIPCEEVKPSNSVEPDRSKRHFKKLDTLPSNIDNFELDLEMEIESNEGGLKADSIGINKSEVILQGKNALKTISKIIEEVKKSVENHAEFNPEIFKDIKVKVLKSNFQQARTGEAVMHAEQIIENYLARAINRITAGNVGERNAGNQVIIPMAGRLVPCGICSEVEVQAKISGGLFSTEGLTLYRASERIGDIFSGKQLVAETALNVECPKLAKGKAKEIKNMVETTKDHHSLQALKVPLALKNFPEKDSPSHSFDTDSMG